MLIFDNKNIIWKDISEAPNYMVSNTGVVVNKRTRKIIKSFIKGRNYPTVALLKTEKPYSGLFIVWWQLSF